MKLRRVSVQNVRSFLDEQTLLLPGDISIVIGPNGGGKTNLLDTAALTLRVFLLKSWMLRHQPRPEQLNWYVWEQNDALRSHLLEKHFQGQNSRQRIELEIEVTEQDVESFSNAKSTAASLRERAKWQYGNIPDGLADRSWQEHTLTPGTTLTYVIEDGALQSSTSSEATAFQRYLETFEVDQRLREESDQSALSMPMITLPVNRSSGEQAASISLANFDDYGLKRAIDSATSRSPASITQFAIGRLAARYRRLLENDDGNAKLAFKNEAAILSITNTLQSMGYEWDLVCTNPLQNHYDIQLKKQGTSFKLGAASSGERELLTYLFAIYALNIRNSLIVVDEPELHLHPRWQQILLGLFERLARDTSNQFLMATHSPVFVSPASIQYVSRVFSENQRSRIVRLGDSAMPNIRHLFNIVNSQNNERVFFADLVVLVEGLSDRIMFDALFRHFGVGEGGGKVYEIISVGGKGLFSQYEKLLKACQVPYAIIADLDYVRELGGGAMDRLFSLAMDSVQQDVIENVGSLDGQQLVLKLDNAINGGSLDELRDLWRYIKARRTRVRPDLSDVDSAALSGFIEDQRPNRLFILKRGALEAYLPNGFKAKDLEKVIQLANDPNMWDCLPESKDELKFITTSIAALLA